MAESRSRVKSCVVGIRQGMGVWAGGQALGLNHPSGEGRVGRLGCGRVGPETGSGTVCVAGRGRDYGGADWF